MVEITACLLKHPANCDYITGVVCEEFGKELPPEKQIRRFCANKSNCTYQAMYEVNGVIDNEHFKEIGKEYHGGA